MRLNLSAVALLGTLLTIVPRLSAFAAMEVGQAAPALVVQELGRSEFRPRRTARQGSSRKLLGHLVSAVP